MPQEEGHNPPVKEASSLLSLDRNEFDLDDLSIPCQRIVNNLTDRSGALSFGERVTEPLKSARNSQGPGFNCRSNLLYVSQSNLLLSRYRADQGEPRPGRRARRS